jgi:guanylate kinase
MTLKPSQVRKYTRFPKGGSVLGGFDVKEATLDIDNGTWFVMFDGKVSRRQARNAMAHFINRVTNVPTNERSFSTPKVIPIELKCDEVTTVMSNPSGRVTIAKGHLSFDGVLKNPTSVAEFKKEMNDMVTHNPHKVFRDFTYNKLNDKEFLDKLWSFVSYSGESYGWVTNNGRIFHRRASLIMPKIKINKRPDNEVAFYHTHPSKDEPSLTSADDIQFYADLSFAPGVKRHYTVMRDRIDYFQFNVKNPKMDEYLKIDEDHFVQDIDAMIEEGEKKYTGKKDLDAVEFCRLVTQHMVDKINEKYKGLMNITYKHFVNPEYKGDEDPLFNPLPPPPSIPLPFDKRWWLRKKWVVDYDNEQIYMYEKEKDFEIWVAMMPYKYYGGGLIRKQGTMAFTCKSRKGGKFAEEKCKDWIEENLPKEKGLTSQFVFRKNAQAWGDDYYIVEFNGLYTAEQEFAESKLRQQTLPNPTNPKIPSKYHHHSLTDLQGVDYSWVHYGGDEFAHTLYTYYWMRYYFEPNQQGVSRMYMMEDIGFDSDLRKKVRAYLNRPITGNWTYLDLLFVVGLYHDIGKVREKETGEHHSIAGKYMWDEFIADELDVPATFEDIVSTMFESDIGRRNITDEFFQTIIGDYYGVALLMQMTDIATHHPRMSVHYAKLARQSGTFKGDVNAFKKWSMAKKVERLRTFLDQPRSNPRPKATQIKWVADYGVEGMSQRLVEEILDPYKGDNESVYRFGRQHASPQAYFYLNSDNFPEIRGMVPDDVTIAGRLIPKTSVIWLHIGETHRQDDFGEKLAQTIYEALGEILKGIEPRVKIDKVETGISMNPRKAKKVDVILVSGPPGTGKSTFIRYLKKNFSVVGEPLTVTSRPPRPKEKDGVDRIFTTKAEFEKMIEADQFVEWKKQKNGHYYGRRWVDFKFPVNVVDLNLKGIRSYQEAFPNAYSIFLAPDVPPKSMVKRIMRRGGVGIAEARRRANLGPVMVSNAKKMNWDQFVTVKSGSYNQVFADITAKMNSVFDNPRVHESMVMISITPELRPQQTLDGRLLPFNEREQQYIRERQRHIDFNHTASGADYVSFIVPEYFTDEQLPSGSIRSPVNRKNVLVPSPDAPAFETFLSKAELPMGNPMHYPIPSPPADATLDWFIPENHLEQPHVLAGVDVVYRDAEWMVVKLTHAGALVSYSHFFRQPQSQLSTKRWDMVKAYEQFFPFYFIAKADAQGIADGYAIVASQVKRHYPIGEFRDAKNREIRPIPSRLLDILSRVAVQHGDTHLQQHIGHLRVETPEQREAWGRDSRGYVRSSSFQQIQQEYPSTQGVKKEREELRKQREPEKEVFDAEIARRENEAIEAGFQQREEERILRAEQQRLATERAAERAASARAEQLEKQSQKFAGMSAKERAAAIREEQMRQRIRRNPKELFDWFEEWVHLINMKNKELEAFLDSPLGKQAGLSKQQAKDWNNIKSGRVSGRRILKMRAKLGLTGPKDYIKAGPRIIEDYYEKALNSWTGPSDDPLKGETDWDWCKRQVRFVKRTSAFPYNPNAEERKGPLVRVQKTQAKPSRRLLSLWVWGHDPWRWARKNGFERMSPCPDVPWVGMTEKRKYGKIEVKQNPPSTNLEWIYTPKDPNVSGSMHVLQGYDRAKPLRSLPPTMNAVGVYDELIENVQVKWDIVNRVPDRWPYRTQWFDSHGISSVAENIQIHAADSGKGHGQAAYLKVLDYVDAVYSRPIHSTQAERAWEALEKRQTELGITIEKVPDVWGGDGPHSARLMKRLKQNPADPYAIANPPKRIKPNELAKLAVKSITKKNFINAGFFGSVFYIPGTKLVFKVERLADPEYYAELSDWLQGKGKKPKFPADQRRVFKYNWDFDAEDFAFPLYAIGDGKSGRYHTIMEFLGSVPLDALTPLRDRKNMWKPRYQMKQTLEYMKQLGGMHQSVFDRFARNFAAAKALNLQPDFNLPNFLIALDGKRISLIDWFWEYGPSEYQLEDTIDAYGVEALTGASSLNYMLGRLGRSRVQWLMKTPEQRKKMAEKRNANWRVTWPQWEEAMADYAQAYDLFKKVFPKMLKALKKNGLIIEGQSLFPQEELDERGRMPYEEWVLNELRPPAPNMMTAKFWKEKMKERKKGLLEGEGGFRDDQLFDWGLQEVVANAPSKITPSYVRSQPDTLFVFGDNDQRRGAGGQAKIRNEPNTIGFRTKKAPRTNASAYYTDSEYKENISKMKEDLEEISRRSADYDSVYFIPGIGEGRAKLKEKAPKTYAWMKENLPTGETFHGLSENDFKETATFVFDSAENLVSIERVKGVAGKGFHYRKGHYSYRDDPATSTHVEYAGQWLIDSEEQKLDWGDIGESSDLYESEHQTWSDVINGISFDPLSNPWFPSDTSYPSALTDQTISITQLSNPRTPGGKKVPTRYLKGLTKLERMIAEDEIDKGYEYDVDDPEAYEFWKSDIKAKARGLKIGSSKHKEEYYRRYRENIDEDYKPSGSTSKQKFLNRIRKETGIKKSILEKTYDKGLAAWRTGHRPGVQQHQWAAGRVYALAVGADSSTGPGKPDHSLAVEAGVR